MQSSPQLDRQPQYELRWATLVKESAVRALEWWHSTSENLPWSDACLEALICNWLPESFGDSICNCSNTRWCHQPVFKVNSFNFPRKEIVASKWPPAANLLKTQQLNGHTSLAMPTGETCPRRHHQETKTQLNSAKFSSVSHLKFGMELLTLNDVKIMLNLQYTVHTLYMHYITLCIILLS